MSEQTLHRAGKRRPLRLLVKGRVESREVFVDLIDISEGGCKIRGTSGFASLGDRVTMKVGGIQAPVGQIAWVDDRVAGVAFEGQIHEAVLDHLCASQAPDLSVERSNLRRV